MQKIALAQMAKHFQLETCYKPEHFDSILLETASVIRPGLQLAGFYDYFVPERIQIIGMVETTYMEGIPQGERFGRFSRLFETGPPAVIICHDAKIHPECLEAAQKHGIPVFLTQRDTSEFVSSLIAWLKIELAPRITRHGVLVEVYGEGILLLGESGVGKSEAAIELVKRGHRLIADDAVEIRKPSDTTLVGTAPESIRYYVELRGLGVIDVRRLFGVGAVKVSERVNLVIQLEEWREGVIYDRLGLDANHTEILGINIPSLKIPVRPGRNLAVIIEVAAMNNRQKKMGYDSALEFTKQLDQYFEPKNQL